MTDEETGPRPRPGEKYGDPPIPDPTRLTSIALEAAVAQLKELLELRSHAQEAVIDEKFKTVAQQFRMIERQREELKEGTEKAVAAALSAAKDAVAQQNESAAAVSAKFELATGKQLEQLAATFAAGIDSTNRALADLKERVMLADQAQARLAGSRSGVGQSWAVLTAAISAAAAVIIVIVTLIGGR